MLNDVSPFVSACCGLSVEDCRGCCGLVEDSVSAFGGGLLGYLDSLLTVDVKKLAFGRGVGSFRDEVFRVGEVLALLPSFMFCWAIEVSVLVGC